MLFQDDNNNEEIQSKKNRKRKLEQEQEEIAEDGTEETKSKKKKKKKVDLSKHLVSSKVFHVTISCRWSGNPQHDFAENCQEQKIERIFKVPEALIGNELLTQIIPIFHWDIC